MKENLKVEKVVAARPPNIYPIYLNLGRHHVMTSSRYAIFTCRLILPLQPGLHQHQKFHQQPLLPLLLLQHLDRLQSLPFLFIPKRCFCISNVQQINCVAEIISFKKGKSLAEIYKFANPLSLIIQSNCLVSQNYCVW